MRDLYRIVHSPGGNAWQDIGAKTLALLAEELSQEGGYHRILALTTDGTNVWSAWLLDGSGLEESESTEEWREEYRIQREKN